MPVDLLCDELEEWENTCGSYTGEWVRGAREEKVEETKANWVALLV
jgi:hypothetical protein